MLPADRQQPEQEGCGAIWNEDVLLVDDHQAVELIREEVMLRRVIVCCDCGLVHGMSVNPETARAYFVREDGPLGETIRQKGRDAGHRFVLLDKLRAAEAQAAGLRERVEQLENALTQIKVACGPHGDRAYLREIARAALTEKEER